MAAIFVSVHKDSTSGINASPMLSRSFTNLQLPRATPPPNTHSHSALIFVHSYKGLCVCGQLCFTCAAVTDRCVSGAVKVSEDSRWSCEQRVLDEQTDPQSAAGADPDMELRYLKSHFLF